MGPEIVTGSTRMKAGTATKLVLNTLTTGAMIRLGKTYGNLMVDLRAWNDKLVDRSQRIVMETTGLDRDAAREVIEAAEGSVKTAIVMARRGVSAAGGGAAAGGARGTAADHRRRPAAGAAHMTERPTLAVGLMSGTSLDGVDAALVRLDGPDPRVAALDFVTRPYTDEERAELRGALDPAGTSARPRSRGCTCGSRNGPRRRCRSCWTRRGCRRRTRPHRVSRADHLARAAARHLAARRAGGAGRAVRRAGGERLPRRATWPRAGRARRWCRWPTCSSSPRRRRRACCSTSAAWRTSPTCRGAPQEEGVLAFDTGPGVAVIDAVARLVDRRRSYDRDGKLAAQGTADEALVEELLADPFFAAAPPKSTGRERFGDSYARALARARPGPDGVATAVELTARSVAARGRALDPGRRRGGGLGRRLPPSRADGRRSSGISPPSLAAPPLRRFDELFFPGRREGGGGVRAARLSHAARPARQRPRRDRRGRLARARQQSRPHDVVCPASPGRLILPALRWRPETGFGHEAAAIADALDVGVGGFICSAAPWSRCAGSPRT